MSKKYIYAAVGLVVFLMAFKSVTLDKTIAKVGDNFILQSDLEYRYREEILAKNVDSREAKCDLLFRMLQEKMLIVQAQRDSIEISPDEIDMQMEQRMSFFIQQFGSEKALEKYFNESMENIRAKLRKTMADQMLVNRMTQQLVGAVTVSPNDVKKYYRSLPADSLPEISTQYEVGQIMLRTPVSTKEQKRIKRKLNNLRRQIMNDELEWAIAATLYSEDPGSKSRGGDLGWASRGTYVPEFAAAAFKLKKDSISGPIKTQYGYHLIKMIDRKGDRIHLKHILISPKSRPINRKVARNKLDSVRTFVLRDSFDFKTAAFRFSEDEETRNTGGMLYDPNTGSTKISGEGIGLDLNIVLDTMSVGTISRPTSYTTPENKEAYRIVFLKGKEPKHKANLQQDYAYISDLAKQEKSENFIQNWTWQKAAGMYISISDQYHDCKKVKRLIAENQRL
ncbi:MAG: peptidylprolyl isomerase [Bacteroidia bacterium]